MSKSVRVLVTILGGWFGLHKYLDKKVGMGILYTLTVGLFCFGWIYDCIKACTSPNISDTKLSKENMILWQNLVMHTDTNRLVTNYSQLKSTSDMHIEGNARILNDSWKLINETTTPDVYFKRLDMIIECYNNLVDLEQFYITNMNPINKLQELDEISLTHSFIQRYWYKVVTDAEKLKTDTAKVKRKKKAKEVLMEYRDHIDSDNMQYIQELV